MEIVLVGNELLDLGDNLRGVEVLCRSGRCWLTQAGDGRDHVLPAGGRVRIHSQGRVIVTASDKCRLQLIAETVPEGNRSFWRQLCCNN